MAVLAGMGLIYHKTIDIAHIELTLFSDCEIFLPYLRLYLIIYALFIWREILCVYIAVNGGSLIN